MDMAVHPVRDTKAINLKVNAITSKLVAAIAATPSTIQTPAAPPLYTTSSSTTIPTA